MRRTIIFGRSGRTLQLSVGLADLPRPVVLVLDDFHLITDPAVLASVERLLELRAVPLRLVLTARSDPVLRLHRLRLHGELTEIRSSDLAFTQLETDELLRRSELHLSTSQLLALHQQTQGWAVGVRMAAIFLSGAAPGAAVDAGIARFSGLERSVNDYLVGEILDQ